MGRMAGWTAVVALAGILGGCEAEEAGAARVRLDNDFDNPDLPRQPLWTICTSSYLDVEFGRVGWGETSDERVVRPGLDYVLMVAAWDDPTCSAGNCLPLASRNEEEVVDGQTRTIVLNLPNHQGPCPPTGVEPMPQALYDRILALWPEYGFRPYAQRAENPQCL